MGQIDELAIGTTLGRVEQKVDSVISSLSSFKSEIDKEIAEHDTHIQSLLSAQAEKRGAAHVWYVVYSFCAVGFWKLLDNFPQIIKSIIG